MARSMTRYAALLRAVNVGGRTIKMDALRAAFVELGCERVSTYIASGNVVFDAPGRRADLERRIEEHLADRFGFVVATFLRRPKELDATAVATSGSANHYVAFTKRALDAAQVAAVRELETDVDRFVFDGAEMHWLCDRSQSQSTFSNARLESAIRAPATMRNITTVRKLARLSTGG